MPLKDEELFMVEEMRVKERQGMEEIGWVWKEIGWVWKEIGCSRQIWSVNDEEGWKEISEGVNRWEIECGRRRSSRGCTGEPIGAHCGAEEGRQEETFRCKYIQRYGRGNLAPSLK